MDFTGAELYDVSFKCCGGGIGLRTNLFHGASKKVRVHFDSGVVKRFGYD
jgi:hypothetical protein